MDDTIITLLKRIIADHKEELREFLAGGGADDMPAYSRLVGRYEALKLVDGELDDLEKRFIEEQIFLIYS